MMCDKRWFRIKNQEITMDEFYNANNRTWQMYLNDVNMFQYSLFCNSICFATSAPEVAITAMEFTEKTVSVAEEGTIIASLSTTPAQANTPAVEFTSNGTGTCTVTKIDDRHVQITGVAEGSTTVTAKAGNVTATLNVNVSAS